MSRLSSEAWPLSYPEEAHGVEAHMPDVDKANNCRVGKKVSREPAETCEPVAQAILEILELRQIPASEMSAV